MPPQNSPIRAKSHGVELKLRLQPKSSRNAVIVEADGRVRVAVTAPPVDGQANKALLAFLARTLAIPKRQVTLTRGATSREKTVFIEETDAETVCSRLGIPGDSYPQGVKS